MLESNMPPYARMNMDMFDDWQGWRTDQQVCFLLRIDRRTLRNWRGGGGLTRNWQKRIMILTGKDWFELFRMKEETE